VDRLFGGAERDTLFFGNGDIANGGADGDSFRIDARAGGIAIIEDFNFDEGDELRIRGGLTDTLERLPVAFVDSADGLAVEVQLDGETVIRLLKHSELSLGTPDDVRLR
jgi:Ca2+-binding RTX toxin-like protein